jgi:UDP-N-acetylglucosamine acyltransferase
LSGLVEIQQGADNDRCPADGLEGREGLIDARAVISPQADIAADVAIGPFSLIGPDVVIGTGTWIGPHVVINGPTRIGAGNKIFQFASIGDAPQDKKYRGEPTRLEIGDRNVFRESVTVNRGTTHGRGVTRIGSDNLFMAYSHVAHDCQLGDQIVLANCATLGGHVELGDWVIMGGLSAVHQFTKVGAHCFLAHNAAVTRDVPPYVMAVGRPAVPHSVNSEGLKRRGFTEAQIRNIRRAYRVLYRSGLKLDAALEELDKAAATAAEIQPFVDFIKHSTRSIVR